MNPTIVALHLSTAKRVPLTPADRVTAVAGAGLQGDRHAREGAQRQVLVVEQEVLERLALAPGAIREQVTVRGLDLGSLAPGARVRVGDAVLEVAEPCAPCGRMDEIRPGLAAALTGRRGRFMIVVEGGTFAVGDALRLETA